MASIWDPIYGWVDSLTGNQQTAPTPPPAPPMPTPTPTPGSPSQPLGTTLTNNPITTAASGAVNNIHSGSAAALAAARRAAGALSGAGQQISDQGAVEGGNPAVAQPVSSGLNPAPSLPQPNYHMPWPRAQVPPGAPQAAAPPAAGGGGQQPYGSPWDPQGTGYAAAQRLQNPWDPQGAGWQAAQRLAAQQPPVQGALASQAPSSPFTMVLRPNAPAGQSGGRGGGGTPLATALDLSGWRPQAPPPPAPPSYNLGYGGGRGSAPAYRAQAPGVPPGAYVGPQGPIGKPVPDSLTGSTLGASGIVYGPRGTQLMNPGADISINNPKSALSKFFNNSGNQYPANTPF